jgi:hypothetical protein
MTMLPVVDAETPFDGAAVMVGIVGAVPAEAALRAAFAEAERRGAMVHVVAAGPATPADDALLRDLVDRWAEKYPGIPVTIRIRRRVDAAVTLVAATRFCAVTFVPRMSGTASSAVMRALARRAHCPMIVVDG